MNPYPVHTPLYYAFNWFVRSRGLKQPYRDRNLREMWKWLLEHELQQEGM